jgi:putative glutamine amidotransferase
VSACVLTFYDSGKTVVRRFTVVGLDEVSISPRASMPIIGITSHRVGEPLARSGVVQLYIDAVSAAGGAPVGVLMSLPRDALRALFEVLDGILLPGGDDVAPERYGREPHPGLSSVDEVRDELEITMASWALESRLPILGICRGIQVLAVAAGGDLYQDIPTELKTDLNHWTRGSARDHLSHTVAIAAESRLAFAVGRTASTVNSFHHQSVRDLPRGFSVTARSEDGVIEAIEALDHPFAMGVQCHPEGLWKSTAPEFSGLFRAFVGAAAEHRRASSLS